jgi:hypothetical protein
MPSVIFHVRGKKFRPEIELAKTKLKAYRIHHVGEVIKRKRGDFVYKDSGFCVRIGSKNNEDLTVQIKAVAKFVKKHFAEIKRLKNADDKTLDFGYSMRFDKTGEPFWVQSNKLPTEFLKLCGDLKIGIELSFYYCFTVNKLISHYVKVFKLKYPKRKRTGK